MLLEEVHRGQSVGGVTDGLSQLLCYLAPCKNRNRERCTLQSLLEWNGRNAGGGDHLPSRFRLINSNSSVYFRVSHNWHIFAPVDDPEDRY